LTANLTQSDSGKKRKIKSLGSGAAAEFGDGPDMHKIPLRKRLQSNQPPHFLPSAAAVSPSAGSLQYESGNCMIIAICPAGVIVRLI
jgi:hypothetical protein